MPILRPQGAFDPIALSGIGIPISFPHPPGTFAPMKILLVEDEPQLAEVITRSLTRERFTVETAATKGEALRKVADHSYDLILLDIMLPGGSGLEVLRALKESGKQGNVIIISARDSLDDKLAGLDLGADDYLIKPFSFDELSARLRVMTRKKYGEKTGIISVGDLTVDTAARRVERAGREISLSAKEYELLQYLVMNKGVVLSREKIEDHIWNYDYEGGTNVVDVYIRYLRKKIDEGEDIKLIHTVRGAGYVIK